MITSAVIETTNGNLYLRKLCKHFAHKVPATFNESQGLIEFPFGSCRIEADNTQVNISIKVEESNQAEFAEKTINDHLLRMAHKEPIAIEWHHESLEAEQQ